MEQFVELMLATNRKAGEMIDKARQAKAQAVADAQKQAEEICAADEQRLAAGRAQVDAAPAEQKQAQAKALDEEFLRAKHALDGRFDANRDAWLDGLCQRMFEA